jgi:hypothetical protein
MKTGQLKTILEKYFEGLSTLEEEQALLDFFSGDQAAGPEWNHYRQYFTMLRAQREHSVYTPAFEKRLASLFREETKSSPITRNMYLRYIAAASFAVLLGISGLLLVRSRFTPERDTFDNPQVAYVEAQKTLLYISQKMNKGIEPLSNVTKINTGTDQLKKLNTLDNGLNMLNFVSIINKSSNMKK